MTATIEDRADELEALRDDLAYHQARVLLLVQAVSRVRGTGSKLDGLTKLAKLDFLVRYPDLALRVLDALSSGKPSETQNNGATAEAPMIRYKYGPWDNRYYPVIGALVGRGLLRYRQGRRGSVALACTQSGQQLADDFANSEEWGAIAVQCKAVAEAAGAMTGNALKDLVYERLPELLDRPHRTEIT